MKKQLDLNQMGLIELESKEMESVEGGGIFGAILGFVVGAVAALIFDIPIAISGEPDGSNSSNWLACGLIGAAVGGVFLPF